MKGFWEFDPTGKRPVRLLARYLRHTRVRIPLTPEPPSPTCYMPGTFVLAAQDYPMGRDVFYVRLDGAFCDGLWLPYSKRVDDRSVIVDAKTLGPRGSLNRRLSRADRREFRRWAAIVRNQWREWAADNAPCELYRSRWQSFVDRFTGRPDAASVTLNSETEIVRFDGWNSLHYAHEAFFYPAVPNRIGPDFSDSREIVAFARIAPRMQADAGLRRWVQRVWFVDHAGDESYLDGRSPRDNYKGCVDLLKIRPGLLSPQFDGRDVQPDRDNECLTRKRRWLSKLETTRNKLETP